VGWAASKNLIVDRWKINGLCSVFRESCKWELGVRLGQFDSESLRVDNLESEVVGGTGGTADRGGVS
jgi:hypothetical protein